MMFQVYWIDHALVPFKWAGVFVTSVSEGIYSPADISGRGGVKTTEHLAGKDAKPHLDLVQP